MLFLGSSTRPNEVILRYSGIISTYTDRSQTQLHWQGEEPTVKGAHIMTMITTPTRLRTTQ
jgi:hypothetical protein